MSIKITPELVLDHNLLKAQKQELWKTIIGIEMFPNDASAARTELLQGILNMLDTLDDECEAVQPTVSTDNEILETESAP